MRGIFIDKSIKAKNYYRRASGIGWINMIEICFLEEYATIGIKGNGINDITENDLRREQGLDIRGAYFYINEGEEYYGKVWKYK